MKPLNIIKDLLRSYPLAATCCLLTLIGVGAIFLRSGIGIELAIQETELTSRIRIIDQNVKNSNDLEGDVEKVAAFVEGLGPRLFDREERAVNINFFYAMESRLNVRIVDINQMPGQYPLYAKGGVHALKLHSTITYNMTLDASFKEVLVFLHELQRVDPLIRVVDLQVSKAKALGSGRDRVNARVQLIVLAQK